MKKLISFLLIIICCSQLRATNFSGGKITYHWVSDSTYKFSVVLYTPCDSATASLPSSMSICYFNSCNAVSGTIPMLLFPTTAQPLAPRLKEYTYHGTFTVPSRCNFWTFYTSVPARNASNNLNSNNTNIYLEATLNNIIAQDMSSPDFFLPPAAIATDSQLYNYNTSIIGNGIDSLHVDVIQPRTKLENFLTSTNCNAAAPTNVSYATGFSNTTPFATASPIVINPTNNFIQFTPTAASLGYNNLALRVGIYRNGVLAGTCMREEQIKIVEPVKTSSILLNASGLNFSSITPGTGDTVILAYAQAYANTPFTFDLHSSQGSFAYSSLFLTSDNAMSLPGSVFIVSSTNNTANGTFSYTPVLADTGNHCVNFTINDTLNADCSNPIGATTIKKYAVVCLHVNTTNDIPSVAASSVQIAPNPACNFASVISPIPVDVNVFSMDGRLVMRQQNAHQLDLSQLGKGIYLLRIEDRQGILIKTEKLVKQ